MYIQWKKIIITTLDLVLAFYLIMAVTSWNNPDENSQLCTKVDINISDANNAGFLTAGEIKHILEKDHLYPLNKKMESINPRSIEEALKVGPFVKTAQCFKTKNGHVKISITQRMPIIRIKSQHGSDFYLDDNGGILPNSKYTSDLIIATGNIDNNFAKSYIAPLAKTISASPFWLNQIEQINVLPDRGIELVPRVGDHIIFIGYLPYNRYKNAREREIKAFVTKKDSIVDEQQREDDRYEVVIAIIDSLPTMQQTIMRLRHMEGMEISDIAKLTDSKEATVRKALSRARQAIKTQFLKLNSNE